MDASTSTGRGKRLAIGIALVLASGFLLTLGTRLSRDDAAGLGALASFAAIALLLASAYLFRRIRWWLILYIPASWLFASIIGAMFFVPAVQMSHAITTPSECRGLDPYWDQVENYSRNMNNRTELVMTDSIGTQREFTIVVNAAEQDLEMIKALDPPGAARQFHEQWIILSDGWIDLYYAYWDGTVTRSMFFDLQEVDDELEARQLEMARACT